ncbi:MAG TPA: collagenase-like protease [Elusimicrobia bacterium]|nr:collagenase-like protease [Elusimicrobiota bacterium]
MSGNPQRLKRADRFELLAPAKNLACGLAALECGADAVYIGAERFGARRAAGNPRCDIAKLAARARVFHAKVYAALNTLLRDEELEAARRLVVGLHEDGVDGLIIQDFGLLELDLPPLPLIASTQMHNDSPARVRFLQDAGFSRAILARELTQGEIGAISSAAPDIELESFVHGALCVSYSGRCALSYALGGRSANRGECAQPCRKPYTVRGAGGRVLAAGCHALCLKDLSLAGDLEGLIASGVTSFKIEGRLKDLDYVRNTVLYYRRALDAALGKVGGRKASSGQVESGFSPDPAKTFNRGFTTYFLKGRAVGMHAHAAPKDLGEPLGAVRSARAGWLELDAAAPVHPGDGLAFFTKDGELRGTPVNAVEGRRLRVQDARGIAPGTELFRNRDRLWRKALEAARIERKIPVALELRTTRTGLELRLEDEDGVFAAARADCAREAAKGAARGRQTLERQLTRFGGTPLLAVRTALPPAPPFVPVAVLNRLRREAAAALLAARCAAHPRGRRRAVDPAAAYPEKTLGPEAGVLNALAERFLRRHGVKSVERAFESGPVRKGERLMACRYCLRRALGSCQGGGPVEPLFLEDEDGRALRLEFDCSACRMYVHLA